MRFGHNSVYYGAALPGPTMLGNVGDLLGVWTNPSTIELPVPLTCLLKGR